MDRKRQKGTLNIKTLILNNEIIPSLPQILTGRLDASMLLPNYFSKHKMSPQHGIQISQLFTFPNKDLILD